MHFDGEDNIRCPECGSRNWVLDSLDYGTATEETFGSCCDCPHVWPVDLEELERQISAATCHKCGAEDSTLLKFIHEQGIEILNMQWAADGRAFRQNP